MINSEFEENKPALQDDELLPPPAPKKKKGRLAAEYVVKVAVMSAMLTALKFALSFIPNVEVVTVLIMVYGAVFGLAYALPATLIFCAVEVAIYGVQSWVILYFLYWPVLGLLSCLFFRKRRNAALAAVYAAVMSAIFGVLSACCDTLVVAIGFPYIDLARYWVAYYVRGLYFDLVHVVSNFIVVGVLFLPLCMAGDKIAHNPPRENVFLFKRKRKKHKQDGESAADGGAIVANDGAIIADSGATARTDSASAGDYGEKVADGGVNFAGGEGDVSTAENFASGESVDSGENVKTNGASAANDCAGGENEGEPYARAYNNISGENSADSDSADRTESDSVKGESAEHNATDESGAEDSAAE